jgi:hypothetical protein
MNDVVHMPWWQDLLQNGTIFPLVGLVFGCLMILTVVCGIMCLGFVKALRGGGATQELRFLEQQEAHDFQKLERGFRRMEERLDSLETLLMGRSNNPPSYISERAVD